MAGKKKDIVENALKLIAGGLNEAGPSAAERAAKNAALLKDAQRLGVDPSNVGALKETEALTNFHKDFMSNIRTKAQDLAKIQRELKDQGAFPMEVGTRFTSEHSRQNNLGPHTIEGYFVDPKDPYNRYGYRVHQDLGGGDWAKYDMMIRDPKLEARFGPEEWKKFQQGWIPMTGPRVAKKSGGRTSKRDIEDALRIVLSLLEAERAK
jgi:hypothetical protein